MNFWYGKDLDKELVSFVTCLRVSVLVGIDSTVKKYMPHRVGMQFGMDQDVPGLKTVPSGNSAQDGFKDNENIDAEFPTRCKNLSDPSSSASTADYENAKRISPPAKLVGKDTVEPLILKEDIEDANGSKEARLSSERVSLSATQDESYNCVSGMNVKDLEERIKRLETVVKKLKTEKFGDC
ncbi:hypothetical protein ACSQ67_010681 [Phaseolus vulgaris]